MHSGFRLKTSGASPREDMYPLSPVQSRYASRNSRSKTFLLPLSGDSSSGNFDGLSSGSQLSDELINKSSLSNLQAPLVRTSQSPASNSRAEPIYATSSPSFESSVFVRVGMQLALRESHSFDKHRSSPPSSPKDIKPSLEPPTLSPRHSSPSPRASFRATATSKRERSTLMNLLRHCGTRVSSHKVTYFGVTLLALLSSMSWKHMWRGSVISPENQLSFMPEQTSDAEPCIFSALTGAMETASEHEMRELRQLLSHRKVTIEQQQQTIAKLHVEVKHLRLDFQTATKVAKWIAAIMIPGAFFGIWALQRTHKPKSKTPRRLYRSKSLGESSGRIVHVGRKRTRNRRNSIQLLRSSRVLTPRKLSMSESRSTASFSSDSEDELL